MNLKTLDILQLVATDTGLKYYLAAIEPRSMLDLRGWFRITDAGLIHLKGLTNLHTLSLYRTKITGAGLEHLKGLTNLQKLIISGSITDAGVADLQKALPNCEISK